MPNPLSISEVKGRVLFDFNQALFTVKDAQVSISKKGEEDFYRIAEILTDANGGFSFKELKPGKYYISVLTLRLGIVSFMEFDIVPKSINSATDNQIEFVFGSDVGKDCSGGYIRTVKTFDDKKLSGLSAVAEEGSITEISLERKGCFGGCPVYKIILRKDGTATYIGKRFVSKIGTYQGKLEYGFLRGKVESDFQGLAELVYKQGFFNLKDRYFYPATDLETAIVSVIRGGKSKTVEDYGGEAPIELWGIVRVIDSIASEIDWKADKQKSSK